MAQLNDTMCKPASIDNDDTHVMRIHWIDFLRGVMLVVVLLDHIDFFAGKAGFLRNWTLMAWGFSDAAEAFVFLSGFTFGRVYLPRIIEEGIWRVEKRIWQRTLQIYLGYLATLAVVMLMDFWGGSENPVVSVNELSSVSAVQSTIVAVFCLTLQPFAFGILSFYFVVLPFMPIVLAVYRVCPWGAITVSASLYLWAQFNPWFNLPQHGGGEWAFNPFAWQFLMVLGAAFGCRSRVKDLPRWRMGATLAVVVMVYAVTLKRGLPLFLGEERIANSAWSQLVLLNSVLASKSSLAPLRLLHFLSLSYLVALLLPKLDAIWRHPLSIPLRACGRHSLSIYCFGIALAYFSRLAFCWFKATPWTISVIAVDACILQSICALLLDVRVRGRMTGFHIQPLPIFRPTQIAEKAISRKQKD